MERKGASRLGRLGRIGAVASIAAMIAVFDPQQAQAIASCGGSGGHYFAHQYNSTTRPGEYGHYYIQNPHVANINTDFTLSHLYMEVSYETLPFIEVGVYKGLGEPGSGDNFDTPHYYTAHQGLNEGYHEKDFTNTTPTIDSVRLFELLYTGHDYNTGEGKWSLYFENLSSPAQTLEIDGLDEGESLAGGEISGRNGDGTKMHTHGEPAWQLENGSLDWKTWNTSISTNTCADTGAGFSLTEHTQYTDFETAGTL